MVAQTAIQKIGNIPSWLGSTTFNVPWTTKCTSAGPQMVLLPCSNSWANGNDTATDSSKLAAAIGHGNEPNNVRCTIVNGTAEYSAARQNDRNARK